MDNPVNNGKLDQRFAPSLNFGHMDETHREEIEIYNELLSVLERHEHERASADQVTDQFEKWMEHTRIHFSSENTMMERSAFSARLVHIGEHELALQLMAQVIDSWMRNEDINQMKYYLFSLWPDWFRRHIDSMDRAAAEHARASGYLD